MPLGEVLRREGLVVHVYRFVWGVLATVVVGPAVVWAVAAGAGVEMAVLGAGLALVAGAFAGVLLDDHPARWQWVRRIVLWCAVGAPSADALGTTWGVTGAVLATVLALTAPTVLVPARAGYVVWAARRTTGPPESLSERDLRRRWDATTDEVRRTSTSAARRMVLVEERHRLLDEMEHRDPAQFGSWVVTAVPHDGPTRHRQRQWQRHRGR